MTTISNLSSATAVSGTEILPLVQSGSTKKATVSQVRGDAFDPYNLAQYSGVTDCRSALQAVIDTCFGPANAPHAKITPELNRPFVLPPGIFNISSPLILPPIHGGIIQGAGRFATTINNSAGTGIFTTNGFQYSRVSDITLQLPIGGGSPVFDLTWDNSIGPALQSNTFQDVFFNGGTHGLRIGIGGFMGSENLVLNCFFISQSVAGLSTECFNALQQTVIGGNFQSCAKGILVNAGSVPIIHGVGFQVNSVVDIQVNNQAHDVYSIAGCRTESVNFVQLSGNTPAHITSCTQIGPSNGNFATFGAILIVDMCVSTSGTINSAGSGALYVRGNKFDRSDWITYPTPVRMLDNLRLASLENSSRTIQYNLHPYPIIEIVGTCTLTIANDSTYFFETGTEYEFIQMFDANPVTLVAASGVTLGGPTATTARYGGLKIRKTAANSWISRAI